MANKALIVDNDFFFVEFLSELMEEKGYEVRKAYDGKQGLSMLEEGAVDLIFSDLVMPKIDGKEFIRIARRRYKGKIPPIIALSDVLVEQFDSIEKIGADFLIAKGPIESMRKEIGSLLEAIQDKSFPSNMSDAITDTSKFFPRQVTLELMESLNFQKAVTESLGIGIIVVDKDAKIINSNPAGCRLLGLISEDLTNRPVTSLFDVDDKQAVVGALKDVLRDKENAGRAFETTLKSARVRVTVTMLMVAGEISGWTIALEELDKWVEQA
jgi:PAS domain S-box-containing protein